MKIVQINQNDANQRLDKFLNKFLPNLPQNLMYKYIRKKRIKINGERCKNFQILNFGDVINFYINDEFFDKIRDKLNFLYAHADLKIIYEDDNILLIDKNVGLIVHPDKNSQADCLINRVLKYLYEKREFDPKLENSFTPSLVNRIDRNTSGIVIAAKNAMALKILNLKMKNHEIVKKYLCVVYGEISKNNDILTAFLRKNSEINKVIVTFKQNFGNKNFAAKKIITKYKVLKKNKNYSLLEVELLTGKTHQIRAHMAFIGHPILGDNKYGQKLQNKNFNLKYQALCSYKLKFNFTDDADVLNYLNNQKFTANVKEFLEKYQNFFGENFVIDVLQKRS